MPLRALLHHCIGRLRRRRDVAAHAAWLARNPVPTPPGSDLTVSVLTPVHHPDPRHLSAAIASVLAQSHPHWQLVLALDGPAPAAVEAVVARAAAHPAVTVLRLDHQGVAGATNAALAAAIGQAVVFLDHDDLLHPDALGHLAAAFDAPATQAVYADEDIIDAGGLRAEPAFKTRFDGERLLAQNYVNHPFAVRADLLRELGGIREGFEGSQDHDLVLRVAEAAGSGGIVHLPLILYHWRLFPGGRTLSQRAPDRAAEARRRAVTEHLQRLGLKAEVSEGPGGFNRVIWPHDPRRRTHLITEGEAAAMNQAGTVDADVLVFLPAGHTLVGDDSLPELVSLAIRPDVGAVGPRRQNPDNPLADTPGPQWIMRLAREVEGLEKACLVVERRKFAMVGGFDPAAADPFADLCRRLADSGWRTLWTPFAQVAGPETP